MVVHDALQGLRLPRLCEDQIPGCGDNRPRCLQLHGIVRGGPLCWSGINLVRLSLVHYNDVPCWRMAFCVGIQLPCNLPGWEHSSIALVSGNGGWTLVFAICRGVMNGDWVQDTFQAKKRLSTNYCSTKKKSELPPKLCLRMIATEWFHSNAPAVRTSLAVLPELRWKCSTGVFGLRSYNSACISNLATFAQRCEQRSWR